LFIIFPAVFWRASHGQIARRLAGDESGQSIIKDGELILPVVPRRVNPARASRDAAGLVLNCHAAEMAAKRCGVVARRGRIAVKEVSQSTVRSHNAGDRINR
jgi:hypothetical protein